MTSLRLGSLCSGIGGLDLAVERTLGATLAWCSEIDPAACAVLERRFPGVPNLGDFTGRAMSLFSPASWADVEPVDVLCAGYPCQPFSQAGRREGTNDARHLWPHVAQAVASLRPGVVVLENVRGHLSLGFEVVLGDLARMGYDAAWGVVRASDAGAAHQRARLFVVAAHASRGGRVARPGPGAGGPARLRWNGPDDDHRAATARLTPTWGKYAAAVARWERIHGHPVPPPRDGSGRMTSAFVEWHMGFPPGWCSDLLNRSDAIRCLGNAVVPAAAELALSLLLDV